MGYLRAIFFIFFIGLLASCNDHVDPEEARQSLLDVDQAFSDYSKEHGYKAAFAIYIDDEGVIFRPGMMPIVGKNKFIESELAVDDSKFTLLWKPLDAGVSKSGDLGYTYGIYELVMKDTLNNRKLEKGTYLTIWKKDELGNWKMMADSGNEGIGE